MKDKLKVALITGAGEGIGKHIALALSKEHYAVGVNDIASNQAEATSEAIRMTGQKALPLVADVSKEGEVKEMVSRVQKTWGRLDVLINNAGLFDQRSPVVDQEMAIWERLIDVHLKGTFLVSKICAPLMFKSGGGRIVNIASIAGLVTFPRTSAYGPAKSGVIRLTQILALEWAAHNILVNAVAPGYVKTELAAKLMEEGIWDEEALVKRTPLGRIGTPDDVAKAVFFLISKNADFITGHTLVVDGGWSAYGFI
ncbi:MAG: glucose 1-dehydrogenase [Chloroflexi bacterium]|nr:glucose 1-dehydrogenase [Chloroflexota bacterium]